MWTCNRLDLETLGSQPVLPKNLPNHWFEWVSIHFRSICAISTIESMEVGIYHFTQVVSL